MQRRTTLTAIAAALCVACFACVEPDEKPRGDALAPNRLASALPLAVPADTLTAETKQRLRAQLSEWKRSAKSGTLLLREHGAGELVPGPTLETRVEIDISGPLARSRVSQRFHNPGDGWAEGIYVFPLPDDAAVDHMRIRTQSRVIEGQIQEKEAARKAYERAKSEGRQASLVEQERPNVFTTHVANIGPGSEVTVEIEYQQSIRLDGGESSLRFPMVVGPRYVPGVPQSEEAGAPGTNSDSGHGWAHDTDRVPDASRVTPPVRPPGFGPSNPIEIIVDLAPGFEIDEIISPYHDIVSNEIAGVTRVRLADGTVPADRDFVLRWTAAPDSEPEAVLFGEALGDDHYALLMVVPPNEPRPDSEPPPREVIYVIDTSGSMEGASLDQAKHALVLALESLRPDDRFNVIEFDSETTMLFPVALHADSRNLQRALEFVRGLASQGGTRILPAIRIALANQQASRGFLRQVVFLTDGSVANEQELFEAIRRDLGESRLFTVGIGSAPNSHFMRKAAQFGRGTFSHIGKPEEVSEKMDTLFRKLESVVLRDITIEIPGAEVIEQYPARIPDLYLGEPVVVALKLDEPVERIIVAGRTGDTPWRIELDRRDVRERPGVHVHWARNKIAALMDARLGVHDERMLDDLRDDTVETALTHHLVSAYTSLVAVDVTPERRSYEALTSHALAVNLPAGWDFGAVFGMAQTATNASLHLTVGLFLVALACFIRARREIA
jgi:Ca-activated chloride channel family protein